MAYANNLSNHNLFEKCRSMKRLPELYSTLLLHMYMRNQDVMNDISLKASFAMIGNSIHIVLLFPRTLNHNPNSPWLKVPPHG